jgi:hypothetical protein
LIFYCCCLYNEVMSVIAIPRVLREKLGDDGAEALVEIINKSETSKELATKADLSEEIGNLRVEIENSGKENIKWKFLFCICQLAAIIAIIKFFMVK